VLLSLRVLHGLQSLSIYVPGGIAIAGPVKHDPGLPKTRVPPALERRRRRRLDRQGASERDRKGATGLDEEIHPESSTPARCLTARTRVDQAGHSSDYSSGWPLPRWYSLDSESLARCWVKGTGDIRTACKIA
jgi:hypothetical protein